MTTPHPDDAGHLRPLRADARRNRERILRAAHDRFASDGLSVSLDDIARRAGVGAGTVHRHFPSKESLVAAIIVDRVQGVVRDARALAEAEHPCAALERQLSHMLEEGLASSPLKAALAGTGFDLRTAAPGLAHDLHAAVATLLTGAQNAGCVRRELDAEDLMALLAGAFATLRHAQAETTPKRASRLTAVLFDGLRTTP